ncbi:MAG: prolyl oligopeptidase family serine peptidase [Gemmatimonadota bacterium]|nr:prolyl oligopeptidase family serine peptidase [Gemmatimonadota bacterium]
MFIFPFFETPSVMRRTLSFLSGFLLLVVAQGIAAQTSKPDTADDRYRWLEDVSGARSMAWVKAENAKTLAVLASDPRFRNFHEEALRLAEASDRIPYVTFLGGALYNFWQDAAHVRGIWRKTTLESYRSGKTPQWTTVLDLDSLATAEKANWVWQGTNCAEPAERRCILSLSDGGEDAATLREFDLATRSFVKNGFSLPRGKQRVTFASEDTLLVSREWNVGELTTSGYPYIVKRLARGQSLGDAVEIFRGTANDGGYGVAPFTLVDGAGHRASFINRPLSTFEAEHYVVRADNVARLDMPLKSNLVAMMDGQVIVQLSEDWKSETRTIGAGGLAAFDAAVATREPGHVAPVPLFEPGPRESVASVGATYDRLVVATYQNVQGRVLVFSRAPNTGWTHRALTLPDNLSADVESADRHSDRALLSLTGFLTPSSVWLAAASRGTAQLVRALPAKFKASNSEVEQLEATSSDGTKIPYFVVHPKAMKRDGANPTILYAYGGFEISLTPSYSPEIGKLWLERGGVYVLANIRGGGEFGPKWHEAGLKTHRQLIYDDFAAVAQDLFARNITSPRRLGIEGGSNGGLLMGVELTQHPELWNAVDIQVPLLDMLRFEQIAAGSSWVGEYGSVSNPEERAFLERISPLNNLRADAKYPTPLIWTTTKDDRVGPQHARKFAAKLSDLGKPYLFYEVIEGGHGSGANIKQRAYTTALEFTYFARQLMNDARPIP